MGTFQYQGFGVLSEWNGQVAGPSAQVAMQNIAATGSNSIEIVPRIWTQTTSSTTVLSDPTKTESDASLIQGIANAHTDGLKVILKPNISTLDGHGSSALDPSDVGAFFTSYKAEVVHLATIAQQTGVEVFDIGNEMSSLTGSQYQSYWIDIIHSVRDVYHGDVTYSAATDEASNVSFWGQLDTIGVNTYPPLAVSGTPTVDQLVADWSQVPSNPYWAAAFEHMSPIDFLHSLSQQYNEPLLMTEAGYRSIDYGSTITGSWQTSGTMSLQEQADAYAAFMQVWTTHGGPWLQGVEFWQWDLDNKFSPLGYSPMGKPAEAIVSEYFKGVGPMVASDIASLTDAQIADLSAAGITTIVATDHTVQVGASEAAALAAAHISLSEPYGTGAQTLTWNADGSLHDIHYYAISSGSYSDYDVVFNANGQPVTATYSDGLTKTWHYNPDGSLHELIQNNIVGQPWTTTDTVYGSNGTPASESWHNGADLVQTETWNGDGSVHDIHYYGVTGHAYTDFDVVYGANGKPAMASYSNGMTASWSYNSDGSLHEFTQDHITGQSWTATDTIYGSNGSPASESWHDGTDLVKAETWNGDGSVHDIHYFGITGHAYTDYDVLYGANDKPASATYSNGMTEKWTYNADSSLHSISYDGVTNADYTSYTAGYDGQGHVALHEFGLAGGSEAVRGFADSLTFTNTPNGSSVTTSNGQNFAFAPSTDTTLTGNGVNETFAFKSGFGHSTITDFVPHSQTDTNHDVIAFSSGTFANFSDVIEHATQSGTSTVIADGAGDKLTLQHVALSHLTSADFLLS